jgi:hypothetical protein
VSYHRRALCLSLFAALPNVSSVLILLILFNIADVIFEVERQYLRAKTIKNKLLKGTKFFNKFILR